MLMYSLYANWLNEMEKLWTRRRTKGFLLLAFLVPALTPLILVLLQGNTSIYSGLGDDFPMLMLGLFMTIFLPLFLFMTAVDLFSGEAANGTVKLVLVRPIVRSKVFASKIMTIAVCIAVYLGAIWLGAVMGGLLLQNDNLWSSIFESVKAYTAAFVPMLAISLMAVFIAVCFNNSAGALGLSIFIYVVAKLLPFVFPPMAVWSVFSYTDWYTLWAGSGVSFGKLLNTFALLLSYCIITYTFSLLLFDRKQL